VRGCRAAGREEDGEEPNAMRREVHECEFYAMFGSLG
jgi:hypothetical protein